MIKVDLKGSEKEFESGVSVAEVAKSIGMGLYKSACAAKVNGEVCDLRTVLNEDCKVEILTFDDKEGKKAYWHTASHIMAQAVNRLYPGTKFAIGPAVDNGFYYDMELPQAITNDDLAKIEAEMKKIIKEDIEIERFELPVAEALELMKGQDYKEELIREHAAEGEHISFYKQGDFTDLCTGPHLMRTGNVKAYLHHRCILARRCKQQDAAASLRHRVPEAELAGRAPHHDGGSQEARPQQARP